MLQANALAILMILLSKRRVSREYLAERFSVSKRTVSRYLTVLEDAGVPIESTPGRGGGIKISDDYTIDRTFLSEAESKRIADALELTADSFPDRANRALIEKLRALDKSREQVFVVKQDNLYIEGDYAISSALRQRVKTLSAAIEAQRAADIKYTDAHGYVSFRTVEPYTLVFKGGAWYVYALCRLRGDFRLFKLSRINDIRMTSKRFARIQSRLAEKLELEFYNEVYIDLELEFFPSVAESIVDWLGAAAVTERGTKMIAAAELPMTDALIKRLLSFGSSVKVLAPAELVERLRDEAKRMSDMYSD